MAKSKSKQVGKEKKALKRKSFTKRTYLRDIEPAPVVVRRLTEDEHPVVVGSLDVEDESVVSELATDSFVVNKLTTEDMPKVDSLNQQEVVNFHIEKVDEEQPVQLRPSYSAKSGLRPSRSGISSIEADNDDDAIAAATDKILQEVMPKDTVRVKFGKFVNLVASRDFKEVVAANVDEEITMSSNLLTELAGSQDRVEEKKIPLVFLVGIAIGVVLTYIFFSNQ
ncbi:hypothetical protein KBB06_03130 [Candidatus Gracilibacteria bacterium]|nr:hypothetical protein [Candidatus Gracilibacteria bacterium]